MFAIAATVAMLPLPLYIGAVLWLDRFEPEPRHMLAIAFLWGASVAVVVSGVVNGVMDAAVGQGWTSMASAPFVEEALKAAILLRFYRARRDEFDGAVDGVIYAAMVGLGFAFAENVDYYGRALQAGGTAGLALLFTLRGMIAPFSHPLFTSMTGLGLGIARQSKSRAVGVRRAGRGLCRRRRPSRALERGRVGGAVLLRDLRPDHAAGAGRAPRDRGRVAEVRGPGHPGAPGARGRDGSADGGRVREPVLGARAACTRRPPRSGRAGSAAWRTRHAFHRAASELAFLRQRAASSTARVPDAALEAAVSCAAWCRRSAPAGAPARRVRQGPRRVGRQGFPKHARHDSCSCRRGCSPRPTGWRSS